MSSDNRTKDPKKIPTIPVNWDGSHFDEVLHDGDFNDDWKINSAG